MSFAYWDWRRCSTPRRDEEGDVEGVGRRLTTARLLCCLLLRLISDSFLGREPVPEIDEDEPDQLGHVQHLHVAKSRERPADPR